MPTTNSKPMNKKQTTKILSHSETHSLLAAGKLEGNNGSFNQKEAWTSLVKKLSELGSEKTVEQIKAHWSRLKAKAKDYDAAKKLYFRQTDNHTDKNFEVDQELEWVLRLVGNTHHNGLDFGRELGFERTKLLASRHKNITGLPQDISQALHAERTLQTQARSLDLHEPQCSNNISSLTGIVQTSPVFDVDQALPTHARKLHLLESQNSSKSFSSNIVDGQPSQSLGSLNLNSFTMSPTTKQLIQQNNYSTGKVSSLSFGIDDTNCQNKAMFQVQRLTISSNLQGNCVHQKTFQEATSIGSLTSKINSSDQLLQKSIPCSSSDDTRMPPHPIDLNLSESQDKLRFEITHRKINYYMNSASSSKSIADENFLANTTMPPSSNVSKKSEYVPLRLSQHTSNKLSTRFMYGSTTNNQDKSSDTLPRQFQSVSTPSDTTSNNLTASMIKSQNYTRYAQSWSQKTNFQNLALAELSENTKALKYLTMAMNSLDGVFNHGKEAPAKED